METPKNCCECKCYSSCKSYFGGSLCKHKDEINRKTIYELLNSQAVHNRVPLCR